jgi:hypothetical protein
MVSSKENFEIFFIMTRKVSSTFTPRLQVRHLFLSIKNKNKNKVWFFNKLELNTTAFKSGWIKIFKYNKYMRLYFCIFGGK